MITNSLIEKINEQINIELYSSQLYLQMSAWCELKGYKGAACFLEKHSNEERMHMIKLFTFLKEIGEMPKLKNTEAPINEFENLKELFEIILEHEKDITNKINTLAKIAFESNDFNTFNFLQWFIEEQREEENLFSEILDQLNLIGNEGSSLFLFDKELMNKSNLSEAA